VEEAPQDNVTVAGDAFVWSRSAVGPDLERMRQESTDGVRYALSKLPDNRPQYQVAVIEIQETMTDTGPGDVEMAAAHATWISQGIWVFPT
jgi:hypothetical protein